MAMDNSGDARRMAPAAWASWINKAVGFWMVISPFSVDRHMNQGAYWNGIAVGVLVVIAAVHALQSRWPLASWWNVAFVVWLFVSPWVLRFTQLQPAATNDVIVGAAVTLLGLIAALAKSSTVSRPLATGP